MTTTSWLWIAAFAYLLFEVWRGWRRGIVRHGVSVCALIAAGGVGWIFAWATGWLSDRVVPLPPPSGRIVFGFAAGLAFYVSAVLLSSLLFKKTSQQPLGVLRLIYGIGGAFFGLIFGALILWGAVSCVRAMGAIAEGKEAVLSRARAADTPSGRGPSGFDSRLVSLKESLEAGATGKLVEKVDVIPTGGYETLSKLVQLLGSPDAAARFLTYPDMQKVLAQPKLAAILKDPAIARAASEGNFAVILSDPRVTGLASDPDIEKAFAGFDFEKALDYALQTPPTSPPAHD